MNENEFMRRREEAVEQMREMNSRAAPAGAGQSMPPVPPFVKVQGNRQNRYNNPQPSRQQAARQQNGGQPVQLPVGSAAPQINPPQQAQLNETKNGGLLSGLNLPFLDMLTNDGDASLIIGLLLILMSEKADKKLLFALVYILL
ncbi:MAG: hypothetical protein ACI4F7_09890 [Acutalibacteraceae bacterium]